MISTKYKIENRIILSQHAEWKLFSKTVVVASFQYNKYLCLSQKQMIQDLIDSILAGTRKICVAACIQLYGKGRPFITYSL